MTTNLAGADPVDLRIETCAAGKAAMKADNKGERAYGVTLGGRVDHDV